MKDQLLHFNDPDFSDERAAVVPLTLDEEKRVMAFLTECINHHPSFPAVATDQDLVQRFIWNYENLCHFRSYTSTEHSGTITLKGFKPQRVPSREWFENCDGWDLITDPATGFRHWIKWHYSDEINSVVYVGCNEWMVPVNVVDQTENIDAAE